MQSFIAACRWGSRSEFRGSVDHLRIARDIRIAQGQETPRQYLVIYDSVPGGTGYLKELMRDATPLFEVFTLALAEAQRLRVQQRREQRRVLLVPVRLSQQP